MIFKVFLFAVTFTLSLAASKAAEYNGVVQIMNIDEEYPRRYSGVVIDQDKQNYTVLTCAHGVFDLRPEDIKLQINVMSKNDWIRFVSFKGTLIKYDKDMDVAIMTMPKVNWVEVDCFELSKSRLIVGTRAIATGYVTSEKVVRNPMSVTSYELHKTLGGKEILTCVGPATNGLSGGPLVYDNMVYGTQSSGSKTETLFCPSDLILNWK